jgi:autotransporter-associated beta strand protein
VKFRAFRGFNFCFLLQCSTNIQPNSSPIKTRISRIAVSLIIAAGWLTAAAKAGAGTNQDWTGALNSNWDTTTANWSGGVWANGDDATFGATGIGAVTIASGGVTANSLTFNNPGYTIGGGDLTIGYPTTVTTSADATVSSTIYGGGLTKAGAGTLTYAGLGLYGGDTNVTNGVLNVIGAIGAWSGGIITVGTGGTLRLPAGGWSGNVGINANFSIAPTSIVVDGGTIEMAGNCDDIGRGFSIGSNGATLLVSQAGTYWRLAATGAWWQANGGVFGPVTNNSHLTLDGAGDGALDIPITGTGALTKAGGGNWYLQGANTYAGVTTLNGGTLGLGCGTALNGGGDITFGGGTLQFSAGNTGDYADRIKNSSSPIALDTNGQGVYFGNALASSNTGGLTKKGAGELVLAAANAYTGPTSIHDGSIRVYGATATLGVNSAITLANVAGVSLQTIWWDGSTNAGTSFSIGSLAGGGALGGNVVLGSQATLTVGTDNTSTTYGGSISDFWGSANLAKTGTGTLTLTGSNTYTGTTTINGGTLQLGDGTAGHDGALASQSIVNNANLVLNLSGAVAFSGAISGTGTTTLQTGTLAVASPVTIAGTFAPKAGSTLDFGLGGLGAANSGVIQLSGTYVAPSSPVGITIRNEYGTWGTATYGVFRLNSGTYKLITGAAGISAGDFVLNSVPAGFACTLSASNGTLALTVEATAAAPTTALGAAATSGSAFSYQIALVSNPTGFAATGLPAGLTVNAGSGVISGTPTTPGTYFATISSTCAAGSASSQLIIVVPPPAGTPLLTGSNSPQVVSDSGTALTIQPYLDNTLLVNPGKGYVDYDTSIVPSSIAFTDKYAGVGYCRFQWCDVEPAEGVFNWSVIDNLIATYARHGLQFSFGVMNVNNFKPYCTPQWVFEPGSNVQTGSIYPVGAVPMAVADFANPGGADLIVPASWADPVYIARMKEFIAALGARYNGDPNVANVQMLNYGVWGERNGAFAAGMTAATVENLANNYWDPYFQAFPDKQVIVPGYDAFSLSKGAGTFICYIMSGVGDGAECLRYYPNHPAVMEYYGDKKQYYRGSALDELLIWITTGRPSYIPMDGDIFAANPNAFEMVGNLVGYHFVLQQAVIPKSITPNVAFPLSLQWYNDGVAPMTLSGTAPCNVAVALLDSNNNPVHKQWLTTSNPMGWMPGVATTENFNVTFPEVPTGYKLAVGLFASQSDPNPAFKLGIQGRTSNGWYLLSGAVTQAAAKWSNTSGGSWQTGGNWTGSTYQNGSDAVADFSTLDLTSDATVALDGNVTVGSLRFGDTTPSNNWLLTSGTGGALALRQSSGGPPDITVNNQTATISATVLSGYGFTKSGSGTLVLANVNDAIYGNITLNEGVLDITNGQLYNNYGDNAVLTVNSGASLRVNNFSRWYGGQNLGMLDAGSASLVVNGGTIEMANPSSNFDTRNFTIGALGATLDVSQAGGFWDLRVGGGTLANPSNLTLTGAGGGAVDMAITGAGSLTKNGSGAWNLAGPNSYAGATAISGGTLNLTGSSATLGSGSSAVTLANVAGVVLQTFWWNGTTNIGTSFSIGSLAGGGALGGNVVLGATATLTVGTDNTSTTYAGCISDLWGPANVTKTGTGTLTLSGTNTYSGATTVNGGKLVIAGSLTNTSAVSVAAGAEIEVSGTLQAAGDITNNGTLTFTGAAQIGAGGIITNNGTLINNSPSLVLPANIVNHGTIISLPATPAGLAASAGDAQVSLSWSAVAGATNYQVKQATLAGGPYTLIATPTSPALVLTGLANGTTCYYVVSAANAAGVSADSAPVSATPGNLPSPWQKSDVGSAGATSASYLSGVFTLAGGGAGIAAAADDFSYTYQSTNGDCSVVAHVASIQNTNSSAKAGVTIRATTDANSMEAGIWVTPSSGIIFTYRTTNGGATSTSVSNGKTAPYWVKITRTNNTFKAYHSTNGSSWTQLGGNRTIAMATVATMGMGVTSNVAGTLCPASLDSVSVLGAGMPNAPSGVTASTASQSQLNLSWTAASGATGYQVWRSAAGTGIYSLLGTATGTTYQDSGLPAGTSYDYLVRTTSSSGTSVNSTVASATTWPPPPAITSGLSVTGTTGVAFTYQIAGSNNPTSFSAANLPSGLAVDTGTGVIIGTPGVAGTTNVTVSATNAGGTGSATLVITVQTPLAQWQESHFTATELADSNISGAAAAPAGDGIPNLIKYALGLPPHAASVLPVVADVEPLAGERYLRLTVTRRAKPNDIQTTAEVCGSLGQQAWSAADTLIEEDSATRFVVRDKIPLGLAPARFIRLKVTAP